jgi:hypothetical protein
MRRPVEHREGKEQIRRLDVEMNHTFVVHLGERLSRFPKDA